MITPPIINPQLIQRQREAVQEADKYGYTSFLDYSEALPEKELRQKINVRSVFILCLKGIGIMLFSFSLLLFIAICLNGGK